MTRQAIYTRTRQLVTPQRFLELEGGQWRDKPTLAICPSCQRPVYPWGVHSPNVTARFHHYESDEARNWGCPLSRTPDPRFRHLIPTSWDIAGGKRLRQAVCGGNALHETYAVAHALCRGKLSCGEFVQMCEAADRLNVWAYKDLPLWTVPYILVTLVDLPKGDKRAYALRLVLDKPEKSPLDTLWTRAEDCALRYVFADSGKPMAKVRPVQFRDPIIEAKRQSTAWTDEPWFWNCEECCRRTE